MTFMKRFALLPILIGAAAHTAAAPTAAASPINLRERVDLGGTSQWIYLRGKDEKNPILLWLDGGPGGSELGWVRKYLAPLERYFTVVCWDQRGTARSWSAVGDKRNLKAADYVADTIQLSRMLVERSGGRKIYLAGHSGGSIWGLTAAGMYPDLYAAYIGVAQQVNAIENDRIGWEMVRSGAAAAGEMSVVEKLDGFGPPPYGPDGGEKYFYLFSRLFRYSPRAPFADRFDSWALFDGPGHNFLDKINIIRGLTTGVKRVYPQLEYLDFERDLPEVECPVFFAVGRYDMTCVASLTARYFDKLRAPLKGLRWFENSGHNPCYTENEEFITFLVDEVLNRTR